MKTLIRWLVGVGLVLGGSDALAQVPPADAGAAPAPPAETGQAGAGLGGPGESCRARVDCKTGLKCMNQVCTDEHEGETCGATSDCGGQLKCIENKCTSTVGGPHGGGGGGGGGGGAEWMAFKLQGTHPFVGFTVAGGFDTMGITGNVGSGGFDTFDGAFLFALHGGVFIDNHQLEFELAPFTFIYDGKGPGPAFEMTASYAYFIPIYDGGSVHVYWPLRFGVGMMAGANNTRGLAFFETRVDLIGPALQVGHLIVDLHLPTYRYMITDSFGAQWHILDWMFGTSLSYAF